MFGAGDRRYDAFSLPGAMERNDVKDSAGRGFEYATGRIIQHGVGNRSFVSR